MKKILVITYMHPVYRRKRLIWATLPLRLKSTAFIVADGIGANKRPKVEVYAKVGEIKPKKGKP